MAMVLFDQGAIKMLDTYWANGTPPALFYLELIVGTEAAFGGFTITSDTVPTMTFGTGEALPIEMDPAMAYTAVTTTGNIVGYVHWPTEVFEWDFTGPISPVAIWGYCITDGTDELCAEKFTTAFIPEAGATLKITPKIYLGNVGDF